MLAALLWLGSLLYAPAATVSRAREGQARGIDALAHVERRDPGLAAALEWVRSELEPGRHVLLEAASRSYGPGNMISAASATPTLVGWPGHQLQWHSNVPLTERLNVVDTIYRNGAGSESLLLARKHGVTHVYLGREERRQFGADVAARFEAWPTVFEVPGARIVAVSTGSQ
ncbi:MAG: hypothetical protein F4X76_13610 [Chloroflexi bacterium]|nr:hypothetical protein [Chloroflexota bacterium]